MAPPSDPSSWEPNAPARRQNRRPPVQIPVRLYLRRNSVLRDRLFFGVLVGASAHGAYLVSNTYNAESK